MFLAYMKSRISFFNPSLPEFGLPLSCTTRGTPPWTLHPREFLPHHGIMIDFSMFKEMKPPVSNIPLLCQYKYVESLCASEHREHKLLLFLSTPTNTTTQPLFPEMEFVGTMPELNWGPCFNEMGPMEDADFVSQLLENIPFTDYDPSFNVPPSLWQGDSDTSIMVESNDAADSSLYCWPQWNSSSFCTPASDCDVYSAGNANVGNLSTMPIDICKMDKQSISLSLHDSPSNPFEDVFCLNEEMSSEELGEPLRDLSESAVLPNQIASHKRKMQATGSDYTSTNPLENPKKKSRVSPPVQRKSKNSQSRKNSKTVKTAEDEETSAAVNGQSSSSCSSEDDSHASQELNAPNQNGKTRAGRGAATDAQSLYARKRRERINERLRILQNLVPNGTKVDISTMLEEAVQYVKFLQLQIKLFSSDDLWMYAPLAYNGMDIGFNHKIPYQQ